MQRAIAIVALLALPAAPHAEPLSGPQSPRIRQHVEQVIQTEDTRAVQQMKGAVCGTGPIYAGTVDDPIFVRPLFHPPCSMTDLPR